MGWVAGSRLLGQGFTWAVTLVVIRLLEPADYGLMALATVFVGLMTLFSELGLGPAVIQARDLQRDQLRDVFGASILFNAVVVAVLVALAPALAAFFDEPRLTDVVRVLALQFLIAAVTTLPAAILQREMRFRGWAVGNLAAQVGGSLLTLLLAWQGFGVWALVWGNLATFGVRAVVVNILARCLLLPRLRLRRILGMLRFGGFVTLSRFLWFVYEQADFFIVGKLLGKEALGLYSVAYQLASMPMQRTAGILTRVALPAFSTIQADAETGGRQYLKAVRLVSLFLVPVLWGMASVAPDAIPLVLGEQWASAQLPLQLICLVIPLRMTSTLLTPALQGYGRVDLGFVMTMRFTVVMIAAFLVGSQWGIVGVALAWVLAWPVVYLVNLGRTLPVIGLQRRHLVRALGPSWGAGACMAVAVIGVDRILGATLAGPMGLVTLIGVGVVAYTGASLALNRPGLLEACDLLWRRA